MQDYNTIIGVVQMRLNQCSYRVIQSRYRLGSSTVTLILNRFKDSGKSLTELKQMEPADVETLFFPPANVKRKSVPLPDF